jgi:hypothetical protein
MTAMAVQKTATGLLKKASMMGLLLPATILFVAGNQLF